MKKLTLLFLPLFVLQYASAQVDVGIIDLKVIKPAEYGDGDVLDENDTIEMIEFYIKNYGNSSISSSDFGGSGLPVRITYNGVARYVNFTLIQPIAPDATKKETVPENDFSPSFLPKYPEDLDGDLEVCVATMVNDDTDNSNDETCITLKTEEDPADTTGTGIAEHTRKKLEIKAAGRNLVIAGTDAGERVDVRVFNIAGSLVRSGSGTASALQNQRFLQGVPAGIYVVKVTRAEGVSMSEKIVLHEF